MSYADKALGLIHARGRNDNSLRVATHGTLIIAVIVSFATTLRAQSAAHHDDSLSIEVYAGAVRNVYDAGADRRSTGPLVGIRAVRRVADPFQLTADLGYFQGKDMDPRIGTSYYPNGSQWLLAMGGAEARVGSESTTFTFGIEVGAALRRAMRRGSVGTPTADPFYRGDNWSPTAVFAWSLGLRQSVSSGVAFVLRARAYSMDVLAGGGRVSPALTLGLAFR